jgi:hypothetical protein
MKYHIYFISALSGKSDKEAKRKDSLVIKQARENQPSKPALLAIGFADIDDVPKKP